MLVTPTRKYFRNTLPRTRLRSSGLFANLRTLFGSSIIFLPKAKIATLGGTGTIPDAFVIELSESQEWFVVEAELASHGTWQHIAPQIFSKQLTAINSPNTRAVVLKLALQAVREDLHRVGTL